MKTLKVWGIYQTEAPIFAVFAVPVRKEFMVDVLPANMGIGTVLPIRSSPLATRLPVLLCTGIPPVAL